MAASKFGLRLKELRAKAGLSQPELAEKAGLSKAGVADIEQGRRQPNWDTVLLLCKALGVSCSAFEKGPRAKPAKRGRPKGTNKGRAAK